ncbi:MAG: hypothetical protein LBE36_13440 [Flavobacteriaceae bacterium]|jgi:hypothetical protein|nr:hypothetical protein [Flavobacteriaceae bacterium]
MKKTVLEKAIELRAEKRFNNEYENLIKICNSNEILKKLRIKIQENEIGIISGYSNNKLFGDFAPLDFCNKNTNYLEIKSKMIEEFIREETKNVLDKLDNISYLFNQ